MYAQIRLGLEQKYSNSLDTPCADMQKVPRKVFRFLKGTSNSSRMMSPSIRLRNAWFAEG